jgi:hypothetical protein
MTTIYIRLLDEGTEVFRPTQAEILERQVFMVLSTSDYDPENEHWEFPPGSFVRGVIRKLEDEEVLVAVGIDHDDDSKGNYDL